MVVRLVLCTQCIHKYSSLLTSAFMSFSVLGFFDDTPTLEQSQKNADVSNNFPCRHGNSLLAPSCPNPLVPNSSTQAPEIRS